MSGFGLKMECGRWFRFLSNYTAGELPPPTWRWWKFIGGEARLGSHGRNKERSGRRLSGHLRSVTDAMGNPVAQLLAMRYVHIRDRRLKSLGKTAALRPRRGHFGQFDQALRPVIKVENKIIERHPGKRVIRQLPHRNVRHLQGPCFRLFVPFRFHVLPYHEPIPSRKRLETTDLHAARTFGPSARS